MGIRPDIKFGPQLRLIPYPAQPVVYLSASRQPFLCQPDGFVSINWITYDTMFMQVIHNFKTEFLHALPLSELKAASSVSTAFSIS